MQPLAWQPITSTDSKSFIENQKTFISGNSTSQSLQKYGNQLLASSFLAFSITHCSGLLLLRVVMNNCVTNNSSKLKQDFHSQFVLLIVNLLLAKYMFAHAFLIYLFVACKTLVEYQVCTRFVSQLSSLLSSIYISTFCLMCHVRKYDIAHTSYIRHVPGYGNAVQSCYNIRLH